MYTFFFTTNSYINFLDLTDFSNFFNNNVFKKLIFYFTNVYCNTLIFVIVLFFLKLIFKKFFSTTKSNYVSFFFFLFNFNFFNLQLDIDEFFIYVKFSFLNKTLQNGILLFHPIITYFVYVIIFFRKKMVNDLFYGFFYLSSGFFYIKFDVILSLTSLLLGSVWASQEIGWGGFWNWDPIELILVFFVIIMLMYVHEFSNSIRLLEFLYLLNFLTLYLLIFLAMVRLDLFKSIHTFIVFTDSMKLNFFFFITFCFIGFCIWNYFFFYKIYFFGFFFKKTSKVIKTFSYLYFYIFYTILLYLLFTSSLTDFFTYELEILQFLIVKIILYLMCFIFLNKLVFFKTFFKSFGLKLNFFICIFFSTFFFYIFFLHFFIYLIYLVFISIFFIFLKKNKNIFFFFLNRFNFNLMTHVIVCLFIFLNFSRDGFTEEFVNFLYISTYNFCKNTYFYLSDFFNCYVDTRLKLFNFIKNSDYDFYDFSNRNLYVGEDFVFINFSNVLSSVFFFVEDMFYIFFTNKLSTFSLLILNILALLIFFSFLKNYLFFF